MKFGIWIHRVALVVPLATIVACSSNSNSGGSPTSPSTPSMNLAGSWAGNFTKVRSDGQGDSKPAIAAWTATQSGSNVTGPLALTFSDDNGQPQTFRGTLSGTLSGAQLSLSVSFPAGTFAESPACSISGTGTATPTTSSISSAMTINFAPPCIGTVGDHASETDQLTLTKS